MTTFERVYAAVRLIPCGSVATYGQIARAIGNPRPRAWWAMRCTSTPSAFAFGGANRQVELLQNEGVEFIDASHVDMARFCVRALPYIAE
mgnify:CR=1 FL=1